MKAAAVIVCAGWGRRMGKSKAEVLLNGKPLFWHSLEVFLTLGQIKQVVLVLQKKHFQLAKKFIKSSKVVLAQGSVTRRGSVLSGLKKIEKNLGYVLIHDCARPFIDKRTVLKVINNLKKYPAVILGAEATDTLKKVKSGIVVKTLERKGTFLIQTPQGFRRDLIEKIYQSRGSSQATDSAQLAEEAGEKVKVVPGGRLNFKITYPEDLRLARALKGKRC